MKKTTNTEAKKAVQGRVFPIEAGKDPEEGATSPLGTFRNGKWEQDAEPAQEERDPRFLGDPSHTQYLLSDPERRNDAIRYAAEHGYHRFVDSPDGRPFVNEHAPDYDFDSLDGIHKMGLYAMVTAIVANPLQEPYASLMPRNEDRKAYRALDDSLRDILGYARYDHS